MIYPRFVFKNGGPIQRAGGSYDSVLVADEEAHAAKLADGWFDSIPDAIEGKVKEPEPKVPAVDPDDAPPTRAELEAKAAELGLKFHHKTGDAKLAELIKQALEA